VESGREEKTRKNNRERERERERGREMDNIDFVLIKKTINCEGKLGILKPPAAS